MTKIKEVIVVEGKDDTKQIQKAVDADTYETNGSALNAADLARLRKLQASRGLIVFTDPDFNGERLRKMISAAVPGVKHAFIERRQGVPHLAHGSLGGRTRSPGGNQSCSGPPVHPGSDGTGRLHPAGLAGGGTGWQFSGPEAAGTVGAAAWHWLWQR